MPVAGLGYRRLMPAAEIAVIGGSGFYTLLDGADEVSVETPYGAPSDRIAVAELDGRKIAFLPRHGRDHRYPPHRIPYRANLWALRSLGVRQVVAPSAVGSLRPSLGAGTLAIPDQVVDRTSGRAQTYFHHGPVHVTFADPYCPVGRATAIETARNAGWEPLAESGTLVVIEGPRFSTRAESQWYAGQGWTLVGMTGHPEAVLARELAMCYVPLALVTDVDAGVEVGEGVTQEEVFAVFAANVERLRGVVAELVAALPTERQCACGDALDGLPVPPEIERIVRSG
jgi:5'-methylthioadenosine phosphorylase